MGGDPSGYDWNTTPPEIDIEPENDGLNYDFPLPGVCSQVPSYSSGVYQHGSKFAFFSNSQN